MSLSFSSSFSSFSSAVGLTSAALFLTAGGDAHAATLTALPSPMVQGGMIHLNVGFLDQATDSFSVHADAGTPVLKPLSEWSAGNALDPSDPWFGRLDPSADGAYFNSQYGFVFDASGSDSIPLGQSIGVRMTAISAGLEAYFYRSTAGSELFTPVFLSVGSMSDTVLWSGSMWHPVFVADPAMAGVVMSASFEFFLADAAPTTPTTTLDYATVAAAVPGYSVGALTVSFTSVPEPANAAWIVGMVMLGATTLRRRRAATVAFGGSAVRL
jgi:hypothetical protein